MTYLLRFSPTLILPFAALVVMAGHDPENQKLPHDQLVEFRAALGD